MTLLGGVVTGMIVGDAMGSVAQRATVPATSNSATAKRTSDGKPISTNTTARQSLFTSALIVVGAIVILIGGSKFLKDARVG